MHLQYAGAEAFFSVDLSELVGQGGLKTVMRASPIRGIFLRVGKIGPQRTTFQSRGKKRSQKYNLTYPQQVFYESNKEKWV